MITQIPTGELRFGLKFEDIAKICCDSSISDKNSICRSSREI